MIGANQKLNFVLARLRQIDPEGNADILKHIDAFNRRDKNMYALEIRNLVRRMEAYQKKQEEALRLKSEIWTHLETINVWDL